ncbi:MAG: TolC family protein [Candidatus Zixiibacteriota bacterium]
MRIHKIAIVFLIIFLFLSQLVLAQQIPTKGVLSIDECIKIALKNNYLVRSSYEGHRAAEAEVVSARSRLLPNISTSAGWTRYDEERFIYTEGINPYYSRDFYNYGLRLNQSIFNGGYNWANLNNARAREKGAYSDYKLSQQAVTLQIKQDCYELLKAKTLLDVQRDAVKRSEEQINMAKARYDLGSASLSDYLKAKVQLGNDNLALITAENSLKLAQANLNNDLGMDLDPPVDVAAELEYQKLDLDVDQVIKQKLEVHPEIKKVESQVSQAKSIVTMARSALLPSVSFSSSYSWSDAKTPDSWSGWKMNDSWRVGITVGLNIFDGFQSLGNIQRGKASLRSTEESFKQKKRDVELEIRQAYLAVKEAEQKIEVTQEALKAAEQDLKLSQEKYNLGAASMLELLDAGVSYKTVKNNEVNSLYDYNLAVARFEKAIGK